MKKSIFAGCLAMVAMACVAAGPNNGMPGSAVHYPSAVSKTEAKSFEKDGKKLLYRYHEPKKFETGKKYPLVILFHGAGERGYDNRSQLVHGAGNILDYAERSGEEIFFVAGQVPFNGRWVDRPRNAPKRKEGQAPDAKLPLALALVDQLLKEKPIDASRVYATGLSMGGHGTWQALLTRPDFFAAAIPICGWGDVSQAAKLKDVPIWCFHGDQDPAVWVGCSRDMVAAIKAAGGTKVQYREYPGVGHDSWTATYRDDAVLKWLFSQRKGSSAATPKKGVALSNTSQNAQDAAALRKKAVEVGPEDTVWTEVWREEFRGKGLDYKVWSHIPKPAKYPESYTDMNCYAHITDDPAAYDFTGETVRLLAIKNPDLQKDPRPYLCGGMKTQDKLAFKYGKLEVRYRLKGVKGGWPAIWMMPEVQQELYGEIDLLERLNFDSFAYQTVHTHYSLILHEKWPPRYATTPINTNGWNVVGVEWYPEKLVYTMNGKRVYCWPKIQTDKPGQWTFDAAFHLIVDMQLGGAWVGPIGPETVPGEMEIDNVVYYQGTRNGKKFGEIIRYPAAKAKTSPQVMELDGEKFRYRYREPKKLESGKKYPLVVLFHGAGERGDDNWSQLVHGASEILDYAERTGEEIFFVAGQVPRERMWVDHPWNALRHTMDERPTPQLRLAFSLIDKLIAEKPIDTSRVYATGISMGGYGTWEAVQRRPELFAAAMPICGGGDTAQAAKLKDLPIWCFHGDQDTAVPVSRTRDMVAAIKAAGGTKVQYREYPGVGHGCWNATYRDDSVLKWFFSQRKSSK